MVFQFYNFIYHANNQQDSPCISRLLAEIPIHTTSASLLNLRSILLDGCSFDLGREEASIIEARELLVQHRIFDMPHTIQSDRYTGLNQGELVFIRNLSRAVKSGLALWIKSEFDALVARELWVLLPCIS